MATSLRLPATRIGAGLWSAASQCENESLFSALERPGSHCVPTAQSRVSADLVESEVVKPCRSFLHVAISDISRDATFSRGQRAVAGIGASHICGNPSLTPIWLRISDE
jgi:hypothetical protein